MPSVYFFAHWATCGPYPAKKVNETPKIKILSARAREGRREDMPRLRDDIKGELRSTGHTLADLARETDISYRQLSGWINGYWYLTVRDAARVENALGKWKTDVNEREATVCA